MLSERDLKFVTRFKAKKDHWIFAQEKTYFVLTELEKRGNFMAIEKREVEKVRVRIGQADIPQWFSSDVLLKVFHPNAHFDEEEQNYRKSRFQTICYILSAEEYLIMRQMGLRFQFSRKTDRIMREIHAPKVKRKDCPFCHVPVPEDVWADHLMHDCPARR